MTTQPSTGPRPRTAMLSDLNDRIAANASSPSLAGYQSLVNDLWSALAIEAEARAAALTAVEEAVRGLPQDHRLVPGLVSRDRVLVVLAKLQGERAVSEERRWPTDAERLAAFIEHHNFEVEGLREAAAMSLAWEVAEAELPDGWVIELGNFPSPDQRCWAQAIGPERDGVHPRLYERGDTPAAALRALAAALHPADKEAETSHE